MKKNRIRILLLIFLLSLPISIVNAIFYESYFELAGWLSTTLSGIICILLLIKIGQLDN